MHEPLTNRLSYQYLLPLERETVFPDASAGMPLASRAAEDGARYFGPYAGPPGIRDIM